MVSTTLAQLEIWYNEPTQGSERPKLLSKLALLELCGWLETEQDRLLMSINDACLKDPKWVKEQVVDKTFGFDYGRHFRPMLAEILGEHLIRRLEGEIDAKHPGDIEQLKQSTGDLWVKRCNFAHEDLLALIKRQQRFDAPSWSQNRYKVLSKILIRFESQALQLVSLL